MEIDFNPYLKSLREHYAQWSKFYTITDAEAKVVQTGGAPQWLTPFDFGLMVRTVPAERSVGTDKPHSSHQGSPEKIERFPVLEGIHKFVSEHRQVLLIGRPGSGKSTTLARLLLETAEAAGKIPVLIELRLWSGSVVNLIRDFFKRHGLLLEQSQIEKLLFEQKLYLLIDGLNELPSEAAKLDVAKLRENHPKLPMLFTTRDLSLGGDFGLEKKLEMQPLTEAQMKAFVRAYLPEQAEAMLRQLRNRLRELGETPLLLWMLCGLFQQTEQIPHNLGEVFRAFTQGYEKQLKADVPIESNRRWWPELLQELAFWMMRGVPFGQEAPQADVEFRVAIAKVEARKIFTAFLQNKEPQAEGAAQRYLDDLLRHHLIQSNGEQIEFRHQMLQEYYAAEYLLAHWIQISEFEFQRDYLNYLKWTESIMLMVGLTDNEALPLQIVKFALDLDLKLGARLAGKVKPELEAITVGMVGELKKTEWLKIKLLGETRSDQAIPGLLKALTDKDVGVRQRGVDCLSKKVPKQTIPGLLKASEHKDSDVRNSVAYTLGKIGSEQAISGLLRALDYRDSDVHMWAINTLGKIGSEQAIPGLLKVLENRHSNSDDVRKEAAEALGEIGSEQAISGLLKALESIDYVVYHKASESLKKLGLAQVIPGLLNALEEDNFYIRRNAFKTLGWLGSEQAIPGLLKALDDKEYSMRRGAIGALERIGSEQAIPGLVQALEHEDYMVRGFAAKILGGIRSDKAVLPLLKALEEGDNDIRENVVYALGILRSELAIPGLVKVLADRYPWVRKRAVSALRELNSEQTIPGLIKALEDEACDVRKDAAYALGELVSEQAIPQLLKALEDRDLDVRSEASRALEKIGSDWTISGLLKALEEGSYYERWRAAKILGKLGSEKVIPELLKALEDKEFSMSRDTIGVLEGINNASVACILPQLIALIPSRSGQEAFRIISVIQSKCKFYNYELTQVTTPQPKATSPPPTNVTMIFNNTVQQAAGIVQGDQNIQPTE